MTSTKPPSKTLVIDNFKGDTSTYNYGPVNSGRSLYQTVSGQNPFLKPGQLTWSETPTQIDPTGAVITDLIVCGKERVESGILYVYAVGHTGRVYKIQVNDPTTFNPNFDSPVLLTTLTVNSPTFTRGGSIEFFGSTELIYIGSDIGLTSLKFDGTGETFIGVLGSWTQLVPRPLKQFVGNLYVGNGNNIAEFGGSSLIINTYTKLQPGLPSDTQIRDMDLTTDGNYLNMVSSRLPLFDITSGTQQTTSNANSNSYIFEWNGEDVATTALTSFPSFSLNANITFQGYQYTFGTDQFGTAIFNPAQKILSLPEVPYVSPNAISSAGNLLMELSPVYFEGSLQVVFYIYGSYDFEVGSQTSNWSPFFMVATAPQTDINIVPFMLPVSNAGIGASSNNYAGNVFGTSKIYFSTLETSAGPTTAYRFYKWRIVTSPQFAISTNAIINGLYQTQIEMFSKKVQVTEVRVYGEPWASGTSFKIDLIGSSGDLTPISGGSFTFVAPTNLTVGADFGWYNPTMAPTYALGVAITNLASVNNVINKIEIDYYEIAGK